MKSIGVVSNLVSSVRAVAIVAVSLLSVALCSAGCTESGERVDVGGEGANNVSTPSNASTPANSGGTTPDGTCTPIDTCAEDQCGTIDDGCGGTFECELECNCLDGEPLQETCGACGVGRLSCPTPTAGLGVCDSPAPFDDPAFVPDCDADIIYVDSLSSATSPTGEQASPFATLSEALDAAASGNVIFVSAPEATPLEERVTITKPVAIVGGFNSDFELDREARSFIRAPSQVGAQTVGVQVDSVDGEVVLYGLDIGTANATEDEPRANAYGVHVVGSSGVRLVRVDAEAGDGSRGTSGSNGLRGTAGGRGVDGFTSFGANGGVNPDCPTAEGGKGGAGGQNDMAPYAGAASELGAAGGIAGTPTSRDGGVGFAGQTPQPGTNGAGGVFSGSVTVAGYWLAEGFGTAGEDGYPGAGGGGGGGGVYENTGDGTYIWGPGGGGGGAGGCGGTGSGGGMPGGGSFGIFVVDSTVSIEGSTFRGGTGGNGGSATAGGPGGTGGQEGEGTSKGYQMPAFVLTNVNSWFSGDGGDGADGSKGGNGGGGAGGPSFGIYCSNAIVDLVGEETDPTFVAGSAGNGGGSISEPGERGPAEAEFGCDL